MQPRTLLQIIPGFRPAINGLGDFAWNLAQGLFQQHGIRTHFLVYRKPDLPLPASELAPHTASYLPAPAPQALVQEVDRLIAAETISWAMLHWGPYAYTPNGLPLPFCSTVEDIARRLPMANFMHETYTFGPPWKKTFWTRNNQRKALGRVLNLSQTAFYACDLYGRMLISLNRNQVPTQRILIFSNIGELDHPTPISARPPSLALFGQGSTRALMYGEQRAALLLACRSLGIESILDIGSKYPGELPTHVGNIPVQSLGYLSGDQASAAIAQCRAGIVAYGPDRWEKSGVLSTYAAHGLIPVVAPRNGWDGLSQQSRPFLLAQELHALAGSHGSIPLETLQAAADHAHRFYQKYQSLSAALNTVATALNSIPPR